MRLNLGCGNRKVGGYVNVDKFRQCNPDVLWDLETFPWPFEDQSADEILMTHVLEHLGATPDLFIAIVKEIYRVLKIGGRLEIVVPHPRHDSFWGDPTHVRPVLPATLELFSKRKCLEYAQLGVPNTPLADYYDIDLHMISAEFFVDSYWAQKFGSEKMTQEQILESGERFSNVLAEVKMILVRAS